SHSTEFGMSDTVGSVAASFRLTVAGGALAADGPAVFAAPGELAGPLPDVSWTMGTRSRASGTAHAVSPISASSSPATSHGYLTRDFAVAEARTPLTTTRRDRRRPHPSSPRCGPRS